MPIIFPKGVIEKVVEKVVEKIVEKIEYIAISLSRQFDIRYQIISNPKIPSPIEVTKTILSITKFLYTFHLIIPLLSYTIIVKPLKPIAQTITYIITSLIYSISEMPKTRISLSITSNPIKPSPQNLIIFYPSIDKRKSP